MKHTLFVYFIALFLSAGLYSCGQNKDAKEAEDAGTGESAAATVPGTVKESKFFTILMPEGWESSNYDDGTIQVYNKSATYMVEVRKAGMNMTEKEVETLLGNLAKQYNGTPLETVDLLGLKFFKTSYTYASKAQTMYNALKDGAKISIALMGPDHATDPTIQAVFKSITLK